MIRGRKFAGAAAGFLAGLYTALFLPLLAVHAGKTGEGLRIALCVLAPAGGLMGYLLSRLIDWAGGDSRGGWAPWLCTLPLPAAFFIPPSLSAQVSSPLGPVKYALSALWVAGVIVYGVFLLKPLLSRADPRRIAGGLAALALLVNAVLSLQAPNESDECDYVTYAAALSEGQGARIDEVVRDGTVGRIYFGRLPSSWSYYEYMQMHDPARLATARSYRMIGYPLMLVPVLAVARLSTEPAARWFLLHLPGWLGYGVLALGICLFLSERHAGRAGRAAVAAGLMTPFLYFAANTQPEIWMAAGVSWALLLTSREARERGSPFLLGALLSSLLLLHERMLIIAVPWFAAALFLSHHRTRLCAGALLMLVPAIFSYAATTGFALPHAAPHAYATEPFFDASRWARAAWQHLFSIRIGLFTHLPVLWLIPLVLVWRKRRGPLEAVDLIAASVFLFYFGVMITYPHTFDSWPHLRYMVPVLPLFVPFLGSASAEAGGARLGTILIALQVLRAYPFLAASLLWRNII